MTNEKLIIRPRRPKGEDGHKTFSVRIREELLDTINDIAARSGRSRNEVIGILLEFAAEHYEIAEEE